MAPSRQQRYGTPETLTTEPRDTKQRADQIGQPKLFVKNLFLVT